MPRSHAIDRVAVNSPTPAQFKEMFALVEAGQLTKESMQFFLKNASRKRAYRSVAQFLESLGFTGMVYDSQFGSSPEALPELDASLFEHGEEPLMGEDCDKLFVHRAKKGLFQLILSSSESEVLIGTEFRLNWDLSIRLIGKKLRLDAPSEKSGGFSLDITQEHALRPVLYKSGDQPFRFHWPEVKPELLAKLRECVVV